MNIVEIYEGKLVELVFLPISKTFLFVRAVPANRQNIFIVLVFPKQSHNRRYKSR